MTDLNRDQINEIESQLEAQLRDQLDCCPDPLTTILESVIPDGEGEFENHGLTFSFRGRQFMVNVKVTNL